MLFRSPAAGISPEAQAEIDRLKGELADAEAYAEQQAEQRQQAQREMLAMQTQAARGELDTAGSLNSFDIAAAVRTFIGAAGVLPHMGATLAHASPAQRQEIWQYVDMVATWVDGAQQALRTVAVPFADEQGV